MCSRKCFRMPTLVICGVVLTIVLVCITGITLTNSINISNIVKLREKVASDSAAANGGHQAAQTRAALVEQQYSTLQQHHLSKSDLNYISAATHPKNIQRLLATTQPQLQPNKIVIEIGLRNSASGSNNNDTSSSSAANLMPMPHMLQAADALLEGNVDSISLPAAAPTPATTSRPTATSTMEPITTTTTTQATATAAADRTHNQAVVLGIADHNPGGIQFDRRAHVKQVMSKSTYPHPLDTPQRLREDLQSSFH